MSKDKKKLVPELRFPQFANDEEWIGDTLVNIAKFRRGSFPQPYGLPEWYDVKNGMPFVQVYDVGDDFRLKPTTKSKISKLAAEQSVFIEKGTVIITIQGSIGRVAITQYDAYIDRTLLLFEEFYNEIDKTFFAYVLFMLFEIEKQKAPGGIIKTITKEVLSDFVINIPKINEQEKISTCLSSLDKVITAHNQKLDTLKDHKKGLMQNLFPQEGETVPKYRFPEFLDDGDWVEKELGVCLSQKPEYGINAAAVPYSKKLPKYLRITDISEDGIYLANGKVSVDRDVSEDNYLSAGDIVLARTGASVGKSYKYRETDGRLVFAGFLIRVKPDIKKLDSELLFQFLSTSQYWKWVSFISARSGQPGINGTEYSAMPICLPPTINEQQKIASCLSSLDVLIVTQAEKIEQLQFHKKGLMQGLFPKVID